MRALKFIARFRNSVFEEVMLSKKGTSTRPPVGMLVAVVSLVVVNVRALSKCSATNVKETRGVSFGDFSHEVGLHRVYQRTHSSRPLKLATIQRLFTLRCDRRARKAPVLGVEPTWGNARNDIHNVKVLSSRF